MTNARLGYIVRDSTFGEAGRRSFAEPNVHSKISYTNPFLHLRASREN